jgi:hypothetical protein
MEVLFCGTRLKQQRRWKIEKTIRNGKSIYPELWIEKDWPAVQVGAELIGVQTWSFDPAKSLPLEAIMTKIDS